MKKKTSSTSAVTKLEKGAKSIQISREMLEIIGLSDGAAILIEIVDDVIIIKSPAINFSKYIGLLSGKENQ